jgi:hypothetical protein
MRGWAGPRSRVWRWGFRGADSGGLETGEGEDELGFLGFEALAIEGTIGDRVPGLQGLAFGDFEIAHGTDGDGDRQAAAFGLGGFGG